MSNPDFTLDQKTATPGLEYLRWLKEATTDGKSLSAVVREIATLMWGPGKLQPNEYFMYKLYDDGRYTANEKKTFMGAQRHHELLDALDMPWPRIANDKPTLTALLRGYDLPIPETQAMRHANRSFPGAVGLKNRTAVVEFLREEAAYPLFGKPTASACSLGVANIERYDADNDHLVMADSREVKVENFAEQIEQFAEHGYLFQTRLNPHPEIAQVVGNRISTVRMFVLVDEKGPALLRAAWKIAGADTVADNFWRAGNMLGGVDVETGDVTRVLMRTVEGTQEVDEHPVTGTKFAGLKFPEWDAMRELVYRGAAAVPSCHLQGWDVALTENGPVLIELEGDGGDAIMEQLCFDTGLLQGRYLKFLNNSMSKKKERAQEAKRRNRKRLMANLSQLNVNAQRNSAADSEPTTTHSA